MIKLKSLASLAVACLWVFSVDAQQLPLHKITLFSAGVGFFEHSGPVTGSAEIDLPFQVSAVNDALKSLVITDSASSSPAVSYPSEQTLMRTLRALKIDLWGNPGIAEILEALRGEEIQVTVPNMIQGRIMGVERRVVSSPGWNEPQNEAFLSLAADDIGIRVINLKDIASFAFTDESINRDIQTALTLIRSSRNDDLRNLHLRLNAPDSARRDVTITYVIPSPVWKASYRLDLTARNPFIQGWAIVDNDSDIDWAEVEISLVTGRPVSFVQNLYAPHYVNRPTLPLAIVGVADPVVYESGYGGTTAAKAAPAAPQVSVQARTLADNHMAANESAPINSVFAGALDTADGRAAGEQFEFTVKTPVSLSRRQSAMIPLVEGRVQAEKTLVLSGAKAVRGSANPAVSVELTNSTGMKLPAGPITVYDGGTYAGDALLEFFSEGNRRIISYGDDLSVIANADAATVRDVASVKISKGVMIITRRQIYRQVYTVRNAASEAKRLIIEHPVTAGTDLMEPASFYSRTGSLYRFELTLPARSDASLTVQEARPMEETVTLGSLNFDAMVHYASNQEIPGSAKAALQRAVDLKNKSDKAAQGLTDLREKRASQVSEQDRIRRNLEAAGSQSPQGQEYLRRLTTIDNDIDSLRKQIDDSAQSAQSARDDYTTYVAGMEI
ncbi:MAG: DUF4139 domain-containing protein [Spirochaetaceae bacterium]|jgi:hypothetical protein|nr:DUF4139 domain-containing protein [Spirochaetaceae bacterium]